MTIAKILLVDDETDIIDFLKYSLENDDYEVLVATNGEEALEKISSKPDLVILDVMMPGMDGFEVCEKIRQNEEFKKIPVIFLTAMTGEANEIKGLELGADDFIQKPISPKKLLARVHSNLRKMGIIDSEQNEDPNIDLGPIIIDKENFTVRVQGEEIFFPKKEFSLLAYLASKPGKVFKRQQILDELWGEDVYVVDRTIDVHVRKIREKLGEFSTMLETIKGVGYRFRADQ